MRSLSKRRERREKSKKVKRFIYWAVILFILVYAVFIAEYNFFQYYESRRANKQLRKSLEKFTRENETLVKQIQDLKTNPEAWERIAREKYGMQRRDERVIIFREDE